MARPGSSNDRTADFASEPEPEVPPDKGTTNQTNKAEKKKRNDKTSSGLPPKLYCDDTGTCTKTTMHSHRECAAMRMTNRTLRLCTYCSEYQGKLPTTYYFTAFGECFHTSSTCPGLRGRNTNYPLRNGRRCGICPADSD